MILVELTFVDVVYKKTISQNQPNMIFVVFVVMFQFVPGLVKDMEHPMHARIVHILVPMEALYLEQLVTQVAVMELQLNVDVPIHVPLEAPYLALHVLKRRLMKQPITAIMLVQTVGH